MFLPLLSWKCFSGKGDKIKKLSRDLLHELICMAGKETRRIMPVVRRDALELDATVDGEEEESSWTQQTLEFTQNGRKISRGDVQQAVHGIKGVEGGRWEIQAQKVHHVCLQPLLST